MKKIVSFLMLIFAVTAPRVHSQVFKAGAAVRIVTPDPLLPVSGGVGVPEPVTEKKGDLFTRALVFEKGKTRAAIVSIDNLGWPSVLGNRVRERIKGIPPENIRIGELLADEALRIIGNAEIQENPSLHCASELIQLPVDSEMMRTIFEYSPFNYDLGANRQVATQLNLLNIGTARILTIPGEALPNIGYFLKRKMNTKHAFLFGLTNDAFGYILTRVDFDSFERYDYISRTSLGEMTGEIFIEKALGMIKAGRTE